MNNHKTQVGCRFTIRAENYEPLVADLLAFVPSHDDTPQKEARYQLKSPFRTERLTLALAALFKLGHCEPLFTSTKSTIASIIYDERAEGSVDLPDFMATVAPYVEAGSYIEFRTASGSFRYVFTGKQVGVVEPSLVYAESYDFVPIAASREVRDARKRREKGMTL